MLRRFLRPLIRRLHGPGLFMNPFHSRTHGRVRRRFVGRRSAGFAHEALETRSLLSGVPVSIAASGPMAFSQDVMASSACVIQLDALATTVPQVVSSPVAGSAYEVIAGSSLSSQASSELAAGVDRAGQVLSSLFGSPTFGSAMQDVFGHAGTDDAAFSSAVAAAKNDWAAGRLGVEVQAVPAATIGQAMGAYAASYDGGQRIFINADWLASAPGADKVAAVLLEEFGHSIDRLLNAGLDSPGDEGQVFADVAVNGAASPATRAASLADDDHAVLQVGGTSIRVELAATDTDADGVADSSDLDDDNDGISDAVESTRLGATPITAASIAFTYAQTAGVDGYVAGYPSRHDAASAYGTGDRNDPAFLFDGKLDTELRVHQADIFEFRLGGTAASPRVIAAGSTFTLTEGSGGNDKNIDVYGTFGTTDAAGNANNATGGGMGWKNLQTMLGNGTAVLLYSGSSAATQTFSTSIAITHLQIVGRGTHGGWADFALTAEVDQSLDTDADGVPNRLDLDSDNDGISDLRESVRGSTAAAVVVADANNNGTITASEAVDYVFASTSVIVGNADANSNGVWNFLESGSTIGTTPSNADGDGVPGFLDLDSDNDGIPDTVEVRATTPYTANDGDVRNDDADGDGVIGLFDTVTGFGGSFAVPVNTDNATETSAPRSGGLTAAITPPTTGISYTGGTDYKVLNVKDGDTTHLKVKEAADRLVVDLGEVLPAGSVISVQAKRNFDNKTYNGTVGLVLSESNLSGTVLLNKQTTIFSDKNYKDITYTLTGATRYLDIDNNTPAGQNLEFRVSYVAWAYPASSTTVVPDFADTDSDNDGVLDKNESQRASGLTRTGVDANGDGIDDGVSASYQDPDGVVNVPLSTLQNADSVTGEVDYRSVDTNPLRITSVDVNEGSPYAVFTLSGRTTDTPVKLSLTADSDPQTADATLGTDTGAGIQYFVSGKGGGWTDYTGGSTVTLKASSTLLVRVSIKNDSPAVYEGPEAFRLKGTFGGTNNDASEGTGGIGTIYDDGSGDYWDSANNTATPTVPSGITLDDDRPIEINDVTVNEGSPYAVFEVSGPLGAAITLSVATTSNPANTLPGNATLGTDTGTGTTALQYSDDDGATWTDYTWNGSTGNRPTMPDGVLDVRVKITNDNVLETAETFQLKASRVTGTTTINSTGGLGTIRDDGLGNYWFSSNSGTVSSVTPATEAELSANSINLDDDTPIEVFDVQVNEANGWAVFTLEGQAGQSYTPSLTAGTATSPSDYTTSIQYWNPAANSNKGGWVAYSSGTVSLDSAGHGYIRVAIVNDTPAVYEGAETFRLNVTTTSNVSSYGTGTILDGGDGLIFGSGTDADETVTKDNDKPTVSIAVSPTGVSEGDASETDVMTYTVTLSNASATATTITIDLTGTATLGTDYTVSGLTATGTAGRYTVTIAAGSTTATFTVDPIGDTTFEGAETVIATIFSAVTNTSDSLTASTSSATGTIYDDGSSKPGGGTYDSDVPTVAIAASPTGISEGDGSESDVMTYTVTLTNASATDTTITIDLTGTATLGTDYAVSGLTATGTAGRYTITIPAGSTTASFTVDPIGDTTFEGAETVIATIFSAVTNSVSLTPTTSSATGTIYDDGSSKPGGGTYDSDIPTVAIAASPTGISEGDGSETDVMTYTVTLSNASATATTITIDLTGTATLGTDYAVSGLTATGTAGRYTITIPAGSTTASFTVDPIGDTTFEGAETVIATIFSAVTNTSVGLTPSTSSATGTIYDDGSSKPGGGNYDSDKPTVAIAVSPTGVSEGDADETDVMTYTVTLSNASAFATTITIDLTGTATLGTDYTVSGLTATGTAGRYTVTIPAGSTTATFTVDPVGDTTYEGPETVIATIFSAVTNSASLTPSTSAATGTIYDDGSLVDPNDPTGPTYNDDRVPTSADATVGAHQGESYTFTDSNFAFNTLPVADRDAVIITTLPAQGTLQWKNASGNWVSVTAGQAISYADIMAGKLRFTPADGAVATADYARFKFQVRDNSAAPNTSETENEITIDLLDYRGPMNNVPLEQTIDEDATLVFTGATAITISFLGEDTVDNDVETITTTLSVTIGTLTLGSQPAGADITGDGTASITITGPRSKVNAALDGLTFRPIANDNSCLPGGGHTYTTLTVQTVNVPAPGGVQYATDTDTVDICVVPVNDAPVASGTASLAAIDEDTTNPPGATVATLFGSNFSDSTDAVTGGSSADTLAGIAIVGYTADTSKGVWQYSSNGTTWTTLSNVSGNASAFTLKASDSLRFLPAQDYFGTPPSLTCRLIDSSTSVTTAATVNVSSNGGTTAVSAATVVLSTIVNAVNDLPVPTFSTDQSATEDGSTVTGQLTSTDVDNLAPPTYALDGDPIPGLTINSDGSFSFDPKDEAYQYLAVGETLEITVSYKVTDDQGGESIGSFKITVTGVDDPQDEVSLDDSSIAENNAVGDVVGNLQTTDADVADTFTYDLVAGTGDDDNEFFEIVGGELRAKEKFDFELPVSADGSNTYRIRVRSTVDDPNGNHTPAYATREQALTITVLNVLEKLNVALVTDSVRPDVAVTRAGDKVTNVGTVQLTSTGNETIGLSPNPVATNATVDSRIEYSVNGRPWSTSFTPLQGLNTLRVRQVDPTPGGLAPSEETEFVYTYDTLVASPTVNLTNDTGPSSSDKVTSDGRLTIGSEPDALVEYSTDGGSSWWPTFTPVLGLNSLRVRQSDIAGNASASTLFVFTYDTSAATPTLSLVSDTGLSATDGFTKTGTIRVAGAESGAKVEYSVNGGGSWASSFTAVNGRNQIWVRQIDVAGNFSPATVLPNLDFVLDNVAVAPTVQLANDTGASSADKITSVGTVSVSNTETGAVVEYSRDGLNWSTTMPAAVSGTNTVRVRQTDPAGNVSTAAVLTFTLDTTVAAPRAILTSDTGVSTTDRITSDGRLTITGQETGATLQYSSTGTGGWTNSFTPVSGVNTVYVRQTDRAGNVSAASAALTFTLDTAGPTISQVTLPTAGTYKTGDTLRISVKFSEVVRLGGTGTPSIALTFGSVVRQATYLSGDGTDTLVFAYRIVAGDAAPSGISFGGLISLGGRTLRDIAGNNAGLSLTLPSSLPLIVV